MEVQRLGTGEEVGSLRALESEVFPGAQARGQVRGVGWSSAERQQGKSIICAQSTAKGHAMFEALSHHPAMDCVVF